MTIGVGLLVVLLAAQVAAKLIATYQWAPWCWCGHGREVHKHDHHGTYCGPCGPAGCPRFRVMIIRRITA